MKKKKPKVKTLNRGNVQKIKLKNTFTLNSNLIAKAIIEIDHINYGLNKKTGALNTKKRTNFSIADIEKFLSMLDGEYFYTTNHKGQVSRFAIRIDCPVAGKFLGKEFIMIFETDYNIPDEIHTITLFPGW